MTRALLGIGAPHTPFFPSIAEAQGDASPMARRFARLRREVERVSPDLIVMFTADHFISFFLDNMPTFCVGVFAQADGPHELSRKMPFYRIAGKPGFAKGLVKYGIEQGFDLASSEDMKLDHATLVPLHFMTPDMHVPVVPIHIKALLEPLPRADRCYALGQMVRRFVDQSHEIERVVIVASGSFSLEVGGPRMGTINREWYDFVVDCVRGGKTQRLIDAATSSNMLAAGNTGGELLLWIALMGALGDRKPTFFEPDASPPEAPRDAHAYAVWDLAA
jgi:aromatic ring-opening dioxygenase catalytic subunit (LigB family)